MGLPTLEKARDLQRKMDEMDEPNTGNWDDSNIYGDDDEEDEDYNGGSMVYGTMIMEDDQHQNDEDEEDFDDGYGTMVMSNGHGDDTTHGQNDEDDEDQYADYGTMIYEAPPKEDHDELQSLFESSDRINSVVQIPDDPSREDLKSLFQQDLEKLQNYYSTNIAFVQKRINQMD